MDPGEKHGHSAAYFGAERDFWWNDDFLRLMVARLSLGGVHSMLDVGCGLGHWSRALGAALPNLETSTGVDLEMAWVKQGVLTRRESVRSLTIQGRADHLPFADNSFDLATCQTLLIHVPDPLAVLREMIRVTRPGGLILAAEPNNRASTLVWDTASATCSSDSASRLVNFYATCEAGKLALGLGDNSVGDLLPGHYSAAGLADIRVYLSDKASPLWPPYESDEQQALAEALRSSAREGRWIWDRDEAQRYFLAGGGDPDAFAPTWSMLLSQQETRVNFLEAGTLASSGGSLMYLVSGRVSHRS